MVVVVAFSFAAFEYAYNSTASPHNSTTPNQLNSTVSGRTWISSHRPYPNGLEILVRANFSLIASGQAIELVAEVNNTYDEPVTVNPSVVFGNVSEWAHNYESPCGSILPLDMAVFKGHFDSSNISQAGNPLQLIPYQSTLCPAIADVTKVVFQPSNDTAALYYTIYGKPPNQPLGSMSITSAVRLTGCFIATVNSTCGSEFGVNGYYTGSAGPGVGQASNTFHPFDPGEYTVAVADTWGQITFLYFQVN